MAAQLHITLIFFILASLTSLTTSTPSSEFSILDCANDFLSKENMSELFGLWKQKHGKVYKHAQEAEKRIIHTRQNSYMAKVVEIIPAQFQIDDNWNGKSGYIQVPFQVLIQRQIARLLDPSLECARFIYNELVKMSNCCMVSELQRFPFLRNRKDEIVENFLQEVLEPAETTIGHIVEMETIGRSFTKTGNIESIMLLRGNIVDGLIGCVLYVFTLLSYDMFETHVDGLIGSCIS
ncbi:hypothetical protein LguiB_012478 [Lonicera macranthoides]